MASPTPLLFVLFLFLAGALKLLHILWWKPKMIEKLLRKQGIYGHPYKLWWGNSREMTKVAQEARSKPLELCHDIVPRVNPFLLKLVNAHRKAFVVWHGTTPRVIITDPKLIEEMLFQKSGEFHKPEINSNRKLWLNGLSSLNGDEWATRRRILNPAFHTEKLKVMFPSFSLVVEELIAKWNKVVGPTDAGEVDAAAEFENLAQNVISRAVFCSSFEEGRSVFLLQKEQGELFRRSHWIDTVPWLRFLPTKVNRRMKQIHEEVGTILRTIIEKRMKAIESENTEKDDLLLLLLKSNMDEIQNRNPVDGMTMEDVIQECKLFYFAGQATTANLLTWTVVALSMHKNWQERARDEVWQIIGKENTPQFNDLNRLKTMNMILLEVLRLYPPTSFIRCIHKETRLGEFTLPAGIQLFMPLDIIHRDPVLWGEDALEFNPERFSSGAAKASKDQLSHFPFGWGPRVCIGQNFALLEVKLTLSRILQHYSFELSPTYIHAPQVILTLQPEYGAQIILHRV